VKAGRWAAWAEAARSWAALGRASARRVAARAREFAKPRACAIGGAILGLAADWYGALAGLLIGTMLDEARAEAAARAAIAAFLRDPGLPFPPEPAAGLSAAAALALGWPWPGEEAAGKDEALLWRLAEKNATGADAGRTSALRGRRRDLERILDMARRGARDAMPALARALATRGSAEARLLLADFAYARAARAGAGLEPDAEESIRAALADCGLAAAELSAARERAFPGYRDPWAVLGLARGASLREAKRAYRALSRKCHPDLRAGSEAAFREIHEAYEAIRAREADPPREPLQR
jgi:DnaJ-domain-containing protein 1